MLLNLIDTSLKTQFKQTWQVLLMTLPNAQTTECIKQSIV